MGRATDVHICEVAPRDGLQNLDVFVPTEAKCALIDAVVAAGVGEIDAGSFVPRNVVPQFTDVDAVMAHALTHKPPRSEPWYRISKAASAPWPPG